VHVHLDTSSLGKLVFFEYLETLLALTYDLLKPYTSVLVDELLDRYEVGIWPSDTVINCKAGLGT
jgi:hypothetical protein